MLGLLRRTHLLQSINQIVVSQHFSSASSASSAASNLILLQHYGFTEAQIKSLFSKNPWIVSVDLEKTIKPTLDHLSSFGFSSTELPQIILSKGAVLRCSLTDRIKPNLKFLEESLGSKQNVKKAVLGATALLRCDLEKTVIPNLKTLKQHGAPNVQVVRVMAVWSRGMTMRNEALTEAIEKLKVMGIDPSKPNFIYGLRAILGVSPPTWERRMALFKSFGCSEEEILSAFSNQPFLMVRSDQKIEKISRFFAEKAKMDTPFLLNRPETFGMSLEKRIIPRFAVVNLLVSEGLLDKRPSMWSLLAMANRMFEEKFVERFQKQLPPVRQAFEGKIKFDGFELVKKKAENKRLE